MEAKIGLISEIMELKSELSVAQRNLVSLDKNKNAKMISDIDEIRIQVINKVVSVLSTIKNKLDDVRSDALMENGGQGVIALEKVLGYKLDDSQMSKVITKNGLEKVLSILEKRFPKNDIDLNSKRWNEFNQNIAIIKRYLGISEEKVITSSNCEELFSAHARLVYMQNIHTKKISSIKITNQLYRLKKKRSDEFEKLQIIKKIETSYEATRDLYRNPYSPLKLSLEAAKKADIDIAKKRIDRELSDAISSKSKDKELFIQLRKNITTIKFGYAKYLSAEDLNRIATRLIDVEGKINELTPLKGEGKKEKDGVQPSLLEGENGLLRHKTKFG